MVVNGPAALSVINDAYHTQSTEDLLHFCLCPSFDAAPDNTLMICVPAVGGGVTRDRRRTASLKKTVDFVTP